MKDPLEIVNPSAEDTSYNKILTSIVKRFVRLVGAPVALKVARRLPSLSVDEEGNVLDYNKDDPLDSITKLIDQYGTVFGNIAVSVSQQTIQPVASAAQKRLLQTVGIQTASQEPIKVMLVDDHVLFRSSIAQLLSAQSDFVLVGEAGTVRDAIALAHELRPDVVMMDVTLPDGTGIDATISLLADTPATKVVFLTIHDDDDYLFMAIRAGGVGYLPKNIGVVELMSKLRSVVRGEVAVTPAIARRIFEEFSHLPPPQPANYETVELTAREREVVRALANGASNHEIAEQLVISENTVKNHVQNVLAKLHLHSRYDIAKYARQRGLILPTSYFHP